MSDSAYAHLVSARLQIVMNSDELERYREIAQRAGLSLSEWARQQLREAAKEADVRDPSRKLAAIRKASKHEFPTGDIEDMLREIVAGYDR